MKLQAKLPILIFLLFSTTLCAQVPAVKLNSATNNSTFDLSLRLKNRPLASALRIQSGSIFGMHDLFPILA